MKTYDQAPDEVHERFSALIKRFYPEHEKVGLRIDLLMASTDSEDAHAVTINGYPCMAVVKVLGPKERAMERGDAEIVIDRDAYEEMTGEQRDALLDHELYHLELKRNKYGQPKKDDHQRPMLGMRKHDRQFGWFDEIARRHTTDSFEVRQAMAFADETGQLYLGFENELKVIDSRLKSLRPAGVESVTISMPSQRKGVRIDASGIHPTAA